MNPSTCLHCGKTESAAPLLSIRFSGEEYWICPQCLPVLIHHPEKLAGKLTYSAGPARASHPPGDQH
jgi:hypothetical protein